MEEGYRARELREILAKRPGWEGLLAEGPGLREGTDAQLADALIRRLDADHRGAVEALRNIERLRAKWAAPDSGGDAAWAAVGSEAHKTASDYLGGR